MELGHLPEELLEYILSHLSVVIELQEAAKVCNLWRKLCISLFRGKIKIFHSQSRQGNFLWRNCFKTKQIGSLHFRHRQTSRSISQVNVPSPRSVFGIGFYDRKIYVYGGENSSRTFFFNDLFGFDVLDNNWQRISSNGLHPSPRSAFSLTQLQDSLVVTGGLILSRISSIRPVDQFYDDIHIYDISQNLWYKVGNLESTRFSHQSICLGSDKKSLKLVLSGGMNQLFQMSDKLELCHLFLDNNKYVKKMSKSFSCPYSRRDHTIAKIDEHRLLMYGGLTKIIDEPNKFFVRNDAWIIEFGIDYSSVKYIPIKVQNLNAYNGMYPLSLGDFVRVQNTLVYFQRYNYIKESMTHPDVFEVDFERKPTGEEMYRQDFYHTFILDIERVLTDNSISWLPVSKNPPKFTPRGSIFHRTVKAGNSIYLFGGYVPDPRTKQTSDSNALYRIDVFKSNLQL